MMGWRRQWRSGMCCWETLSLPGTTRYTTSPAPQAKSNVHATLNWIVDPLLFSDPSKLMVHVEVEKYAKTLGLCAKQCGDVKSTMPGFKVEFNYPFCSLLRVGSTS